MKNKGFTLVELLAVIVLLIIIFMLVVPSVTDIISQSRETTYQKQINTILNAAYDWSLKNINYLPEKDSKIFMTLSELKSSGFVDSNIIDPTTKKLFSDDLVISISNVGGNYKENNKYSKMSGDYLYAIEIDFMSSDEFKNKKPTIELVGLIQNSDGNYVTTVDINTAFDDATYVATSSDGQDLTSKVTVNIMHDNKFVENIDTSKVGIYYINYTVIDDNGYSSITTRSVIITDTIAPTINLPSENTISSGLTSFDLMEGVSCEDNSGYCDITTAGEIEFGTSGKYIIKYTAKDPSGNTTVSERVITIE